MTRTTRQGVVLRCRTVKGSDMADRTCSIDGCPKPVDCRGWCKMHYTRWLRHDDPMFTQFDPDRGCSVDGCDRRFYAKSMCHMHWDRVRRTGGIKVHEQHFWPDNLLQRMVPQPNGCIYFRGSLSGEGYGNCWGAGEDKAHRCAYVYFVGPIPPGYTVDHTCHNADPSCKGGPSCLHRRCVNPDHLEAVSPEENVRRARSSRSHCKNGHEWTEANTRWRKDRPGTRECRDCAKDRSDRLRAKRAFA